MHSVIIDQKQLYKDDNSIERISHEKLIEFRASKQIIIISGIRRCGKSTLLNQIRSQKVDKDYFINFDDDRLVTFNLESFQMLLELFIEMYGEQKTFYFDEIQNIPGWERFVRRLHDMQYEIYITGSNASLLSAELGTRLTGRHIQIKLYPFSFSEFLAIKNKSNLQKEDLTTVTKGLIKAAFNEYALSGGMPEYIKNSQQAHLHSLYQNIIYRDIIVRHKIENHHGFRELVYYLASHVGKSISYNSLKSVTGIASSTTIMNYCHFLQDSYLT